MEFRIERDSVGEKNVPADAYYGIHSLRAKENFSISGRRIHPMLIESFAYVKKAAAITNHKDGQLADAELDAISRACDDIIGGELHDQFIVDPIQGGAGTSTNMNVNEVIANRASEYLGAARGTYPIHPNDHVNMAQSTNDAYPSAGKIAILRLSQGLEEELSLLIAALDAKAKDFDRILKMGRTQLQDAVPMRLGQEFKAYKGVLRRDLKRIDQARQDLNVLNIGGSAIGTGLNVSPLYRKVIVPSLRDLTGLDLRLASDLIDATSNADSLAEFSASLKILALNLSKISNDIRLLSSGPRTGIGDIKIPARQNGSSIMPGKINPVIPEVVSQIAFKVVGNDTTVCQAVEAGQLQLNAFLPVAYSTLFESVEILTNGMKTLRLNCIEGISPNEEKMLGDVNKSTGLITVLVPIIGYEKSALIAKEALNTGRGVVEILKEKTY